MLLTLFKKYKLEYWVDIEQLYNKISYIDKEIKNGFIDSTHFLLIWSSNATASKWVKREISLTSTKQKIKPFSFRLDRTPFMNFPRKFERFDHLQLSIDNAEEKARDFIFMKLIKDAQFGSQMRVLKDKIRHDFEHFGKYVENDDELSVKSFKKFDTFNQFLSQKFVLRKTNKIKKDLLTHMMGSLVELNNNKELTMIVGGYGSGKSLLSQYILYNLSKKVTDDEIIPIYVPLGKVENYDYRSPKTLLESIFQFINKEYKITDKDSFYERVNDGKVIFILDALDEMSSGNQSSVIDNNIRNIRTLVEKGNKVILTSRTTYLTAEQEAIFIDQDNLIEIADFDDDLISKFIAKKYASHKLKFDKAAFLNTLLRPEVKQLSGKPLFLEIICNRHSDIIDSSMVNPSSILKILTDEWIRHDVYKKDLDRQSKYELILLRQRISESLALNANRVGFTTPISLENIENQVDTEFDLERGIQFTDDDLSEFYKAAKNATFLTKEKGLGSTDTFSFIYQIVAEYLVARRIITYINGNSDGSKTTSILKYLEDVRTPETFEMMKYIKDIEWAIKPHVYEESISNQTQEYLSSVSEKIDRVNEIHALIKFVKNNSIDPNASNNSAMGNLVSLLYLISDFAKFSFRSPTNYTKQKIDFSNCNLDSVHLSHATLSGAIFSNADLSNADLSNADLSNADLSHANLSGATLYYANLSGANLSEANLANSKLIETKLNNTNLSGANLSHINTTMGNDYVSYDGRYRANLSNTDLSGAELKDAELSNCIIINPISFQNMKGDKKTNLSDSITETPLFVNEVSKFTDYLPRIIMSNNDLRNWMDRTDEWFDTSLVQSLSKICNFRP